MTLTQWALLLFVAVALLGLWLAISRYAAEPPFPGLRRLHRLAAMFALATLAVAAARGQQTPGSWYAMAVLTLAFLGGLVCWGLIERGRTLPGWLILGHAGMALAGIIVLTTVALDVRP